MIIITILIGLAVSGVYLFAQHKAYKSEGKETNRLTPAQILIWLILGQVFAFGCLGSILDPSSSDLSKIGGH